MLGTPFLRICYGHLRDMYAMFQGQVSDIWWTYLGHVWDTLGACQGHVWNIPGTCLDMIGTHQEFVKSINPLPLQCISQSLLIKIPPSILNRPLHVFSFKILTVIIWLQIPSVTVINDGEITSQLSSSLGVNIFVRLILRIACVYPLPYFLNSQN